MFLHSRVVELTKCVIQKTEIPGSSPVLQTARHDEIPYETLPLDFYCCYTEIMLM